ncbi:unnamed protein product, partial [Symbiodinium microadriaticum]
VLRPPRQLLSRPPANWSRRQVFPARWMHMLKCRGETTYSLSSFATCTSSSARSWGRYPLAATVMFFGVSFWPRLAIPQRLATSDQYRSSSPPLRNLVGTFATWRQARNARAFHCRFRSILFWNVRSWTQKRQPLKPSGQEASSLVSVAACAFQTPSTYSGVHFV